MSYDLSEYQIYGVNWKTVHLINDLIVPITKCTALNQKPKLFLVSTCRHIPDKRSKKNDIFAEADGTRSAVINIIQDADVLIHYLTNEKNESTRGAHFIQSMCHVLDTYAMRENVELVYLLRMVNIIVSTWFEISMPILSDRLTKLLSFNLNKQTLRAMGNAPIFR
jgi:hypothetical protein